MKVENRLTPEMIAALIGGHEVEEVVPREDFVGHAGALLRHRDGVLAGPIERRCGMSVTCLTRRCDGRSSTSLSGRGRGAHLVVPPLDINCSMPLIRLMRNQIGPCKIVVTGCW